MSGTSAVAIDNKIEQAMVSVFCCGDNYPMTIKNNNIEVNRVFSYRILSRVT